MKNYQIELDPVIILKIIKENPNDMELGKKIREYYEKAINDKKNIYNK